MSKHAPHQFVFTNATYAFCAVCGRGYTGRPCAPIKAVK